MDGTHQPPHEPSERSDTAEQRDNSLITKRSRRSKLAGLKWFGKAFVHGVIILAMFVVGIALIGVAQRIGWIRSGGSATAPSSAEHNHAGDTIYTCPMHPQIRQDHPGKCPICAMELVIATSDDGQGGGLSIFIEPAARRLVGIQSATAKLGPASQTIRTIGSIDYDESKIASIAAYFGGRIEKLYANYVGVPVEKDDDLALIYSPDLYSAQVEYLTSMQGGGLKRLGGTSDFAELAEQKLIELGLTEDQIAELRSRGSAESRVRLRSPITGTVISKFAVEGDYLQTGDPVYRIADLSSVWLMLDLYPDDASRIRFGQSVEAEVSSIPGDVFTGRVAFIDRAVNEKTRTVRVRVEMLNTDGKLRPGDYATARVYVPAIRQDLVYDPSLAGKYISPMHPQVIRDQPGDCPICGMALIPTSKLGYADKPLPTQQVVTVPRDAVLMMGENSVIYIETDPGRFEIRRVTVGPMTDHDAVILEGVSAGETVATRGNFLIDSQMQLAGNPSLMDPSKAMMYPPGPLELPPHKTIVLVGDAGEEFDRTLEAYFAIQKTLAADRQPALVTVNQLGESLRKLIESSEVPAAAQLQIERANRNIHRLTGSLGQARAGFRPLSHALLKATSIARGPSTADRLVHLYCPMVPGGGGDWMQPDEELRNPYFGSEMLECGEVVASHAAEAGSVR